MDGLLAQEMYLNLSVTIALVILALFVHFLGVTGTPSKPISFYQEGSLFVKKIVSRTSCLNERYVPTRLWGRSGHLQTIFHGMFGRFGKVTPPVGHREKLLALDGSSISYDLYPPSSVQERKKVDTILIVPGICNHAETVYVKAFSSYATKFGFHVAVFNHTGALPNETLTAPRLFTYGHTEDLQLVIDHLISSGKAQNLIGVGFSLGGNILLKYLGEKPERQDKFQLCISVCQGYDIEKASPAFKQWASFRRGYNYCMSRSYKRVILRHKDFFVKYSKSEPALQFDWHKVSSATSLQDIDCQFTKKVFRVNDLGDYYRWSSSRNYIHNIRIPTLALNAVDDPLVPEELLEAPKLLIRNNPNALFVLVKHGGHLGFFEGGYLIPDTVSWLDRMLVEYIIAAMDVLREEAESIMKVGDSDDLVWMKK